MFSAADVAYGLLYDVKHQRFELRSTTLKEDGQPGAWRSLSLWLFDEKEGTKADAESILNDFLEVVRGPKRVAVVPGSAFGISGEGFVRISYAYSIEEIKAALQRIEHFLKEL